MKIDRADSGGESGTPLRCGCRRHRRRRQQRRTPRRRVVNAHGLRISRQCDIGMDGCHFQSRFSIINTNARHELDLLWTPERGVLRGRVWNDWRDKDHRRELQPRNVPQLCRPASHIIFSDGGHELPN